MTILSGIDTIKPGPNQFFSMLRNEPMTALLCGGYDRAYACLDFRTFFKSRGNHA